MINIPRDMLYADSVLRISLSVADISIGNFQNNISLIEIDDNALNPDGIDRKPLEYLSHYKNPLLISP